MVSSPNVLVLQHVPHETLGILEPLFAEAGLTWQYVALFEQIPKDLPIEDVAGLVVLGGPMNVDQVDRYPYLEREPGWIRRAIDRELPTLGLCLGSQLIAKTLGARVRTNKVKEIGWYPLELLPAAADDRLFGGFGPRQTVFQWHGDTFDLPEGAVLLASSPGCRHQAFRFGRAAWGLQFHVEVTAAMVEAWLDEPENRGEVEALDYIDPAVIRSCLPEDLPKTKAWGRQLLSRFAALCRARARHGSVA